MDLPADIQAERRKRDELKAKHKGPFYAFAVLFNAPGIAFVNLLMVVLWFAAWPLSLTLLKPLDNMGPIQMLAVIVVGFIQFIIANWLSAYIWRSIGTNARSLIRSPIAFFGRRISGALVMLVGLAIVGAILGALGIQPNQRGANPIPSTGEIVPDVVDGLDMTPTISWDRLPNGLFIPLADGAPRLANFTTASQHCGYSARPADQSTLEANSAQLRTLPERLDYWSGEKDGDRVMLFSIGNGAWSRGWAEHARVANRQFAIICAPN